MATLGSRPLKKPHYGFSWLVRYHPTSSPTLFFLKFQSRVAMVAFVAMTREYTEDGSRQTKLPKRGGTRTGARTLA